MFNQLKTLALLSVLTAALVGMGALMGPTWMLVALVIAIGLNVGSYFFSDRIVLKMHGAVELNPQEYPEVVTMTEELAKNAGIPTPRLYVIPAHYPNAFATGRNPKHGVVALTEGILQMLTVREIRGVIAHEIAHIRNRDVLLATIAAMLATAITYVANIFQFSTLFGHSDSDEDAPSPLAGLAFAMLAPLGAGVIQMAISRSREYLADAFAAKISGDPLALASALRKLSGSTESVYEEPSPAAASLFIVNPLHGGIGNLFSTHPPTEERIRRLMAMQPSNADSRSPLNQAWAMQQQKSDRSTWPQGV